MFRGRFLTAAMTTKLLHLDESNEQAIEDRNGGDYDHQGIHDHTFLSLFAFQYISSVLYDYPCHPATLTLYKAKWYNGKYAV